jgi:hypothetical protein
MRQRLSFAHERGKTKAQKKTTKTTIFLKDEITTLHEFIETREEDRNNISKVIALGRAILGR